MSNNTVVVELIPNNLRMLLIGANVLVTIFATCGNTVAIVVALKSRLTSIFTKLCLISLSLTDVLLTLSSTPVDLDQFMNCLHSWSFGEFVCKMLPFIQFSCLLVNSFSLLALVMQRCWSASILLASRCHNRADNPPLAIAGNIFACIWLIPGGFAVPYMWSYTLKVYICHYFPVYNSQGINGSSIEPRDFSNEAGFIIKCHEDSYTANLTLGQCLDNENSTSLIGICQLTNNTRTGMYQVITALIFVALFCTFIRTHFLIQKMKKLQCFYEKALPPSTLQNVELVQGIRKLLSSQRRGLRLIMYMIGLFLICRVPFGIFIIITEYFTHEVRSQTILSAYFTLHILTSLKGAITPFLYARSSKVLRSSEQLTSKSAGGSCVLFPCLKFSVDFDCDKESDDYY